MKFGYLAYFVISRSLIMASWLSLKGSHSDLKSGSRVAFAPLLQGIATLEGFCKCSEH